MPKTILLASQRPSDYVEMKRCALALAGRGHTIQFLYHPTYGGNDVDRPPLEDMQTLSQAGALARTRIVVETGTAPQVEAPDFQLKPTQRFRWLQRQLARFVLRAIIVAMNRAVLLINRPLVAIFLVLLYLRRLQQYDEILKDFRPDIILLPEDVVGLVSPLLIKAGHDNGIPSLIVPYTIANQQEAFQSLKQYLGLSVRRWYNWPVVVFLPRWVMRQGGRAVVRLPIVHVLGHVLTGSTPPDPWMMNSGYANAIAVESPSMFDYYRVSGIPESKMRIVGAVYDDTLAQYGLNKPAALAALRQELNIDNNKPLLVVGGCPDQTGSCPAFEFADIKEFFGRLAEALLPLAADYQLIVRPHPNYPEMGEALRPYGFLITQVDTARLVPLSEVYVAFASATIRWAVSCGVPTVNYDVFQYDYSDFKSVPSVRNVARYADFVSALAELRTNNPQLPALRASAREEASRWGILDGNCVTRIEALIDELCSQKPVPRTTA